MKPLPGSENGLTHAHLRAHKVFRAGAGRLVQGLGLDV